jgi:hypothetical protein
VHGGHHGGAVPAAITMAGMLALAYPLAEAVYTQMFGDRATARVTQCREHKGNPTMFGVGTTTSCSGTWVTSGGQRGSGRIENAGHGDIGRALEIRIGPMAPKPGIRWRTRWSW